MYRDLLSHVAAALIGLSVAALVPSASAQDKPKLPATGVYNCVVKLMNRCRSDRCETRVPERQREISIDFGTSTGCIRRGAGACRDPRAFRVVEKGAGYDLLFEKDMMVFRLTHDGDLLGGSVSGRYAISLVAKCARG